MDTPLGPCVLEQCSVWATERVFGLELGSL